MMKASSAKLTAAAARWWVFFLLCLLQVVADEKIEPPEELVPVPAPTCSSDPTCASKLRSFAQIEQDNQVNALRENTDTTPQESESKESETVSYLEDGLPKRQNEDIYQPERETPLLSQKEAGKESFKESQRVNEEDGSVLKQDSSPVDPSLEDVSAPSDSNEELPDMGVQSEPLASTSMEKETSQSVHANSQPEVRKGDEPSSSESGAFSVKTDAETQTSVSGTVAEDAPALKTERQRELSQGLGNPTLRDLLLEIDELSQFRSALHGVGYLETILDDTTRELTIFAPLNEAIAGNAFFSMYLEGVFEQPPRWHLHLDAIVRQHIVNGTLTEQSIFKDQGVSLNTWMDPVTLTSWLKVIGGATLVTRDINATNGVLHVIDRVLSPGFLQHSFSNLELQKEYGPDWQNRISMQTVTDFVNGRSIYNRLVHTGQTQVGCRIRALNTIGLFYLPQTINNAENANIKFGEFMNESFKNETIKNLLEFSLIPKNYYRTDLPNKFLELTMGANNCSHIWVTMQDDGRLCFNDGCHVSTPEPREFMASNGYGYVVDKCIVCSGVSMMVDYAAEYTPFNMKDQAQFLIASEWNLRNISMSVGNGSDVTMFATANGGWNFFNLEDVTRLASDKWKPHQWDLLRHTMLQGVYLKEDLIQLWHDNNQTGYNMTSLAGQNISFDYDPQRRVVLVEQGDLWYSDIKGVDGYVHFTTNLPLTKSVTHSVYDIGAELTNYSTQILLIDTVFLSQSMKQLLPLTAMYAPNSDWENKIIALEDIAKVVLENHLIEDLAWCSDLRAQAGERIETLNGQTWTISLNDDHMPCFETASSFGGQTYRSCIVECDILARNGLVHLLDSLILFETAETLGPQPPTVPTMPVRPSAPTFFARPTPTKIEDPTRGGLPLPTFFGAVPPAYAPISRDGQLNSAATPGRGAWAAFIVGLSVVIATIACV